jgi:hypothetical protein
MRQGRPSPGFSPGPLFFLVSGGLKSIETLLLWLIGEISTEIKIIEGGVFVPKVFANGIQIEY